MIGRKWGRVSGILFLCVIWYSVSSVNNIIGKTLLNQFPYPMTVTMVQFLSIAIYSIPLLKYYVKETGIVKVESSIFKRILIPLAIGKFIAAITAHVSIWRVPVSYSHTVKATTPLFTVVWSRLLFGEAQTPLVYFSLMPIICGAAIASMTEFHFDLIGMLSALISTAVFSLQHIFSKRVLKRTEMHQFQLLATLGRLSLFMFLPFWFIVDARKIIAIQSTEIPDPGSVVLLLITDGFLNFCQNILAFTILKIVTPLTFAVAGATKRIVVIAVSILMFRNPVSWTNVLGILMACGGVLIYNRAKHIEDRKRQKLPFVLNDSNSNYLKNGKMSLV